MRGEFHHLRERVVGGEEAFGHGIEQAGGMNHQVADEDRAGRFGPVPQALVAEAGDVGFDGIAEAEFVPVDEGQSGGTDKWFA